MNRIKAIFALGVMSISTAAISAPAFAQSNSAIFPASMCQATSPEDVERLSFNGSFVENTTTNKTAQIICPINNPTFIRGVIALVGVFFVKEFSPSCNLRSFKRDSSLLGVSPSLPSSDGKQLITLPRINPGDYYTLTCKLPPGTRMFNYQLSAL